MDADKEKEKEIRFSVDSTLIRDGSGAVGMGDHTLPSSPTSPNGVGPHKRQSMSSRRASFFIGDEGQRVPVKIVGPDDQEIPADEIVVPPNGGYGYVIVFAAFFSNVVVDGIVFSYSPLKNSIKNDTRLGELDESTVAWAGSLQTGFYLLAGPFVSAIANTFGFRTVAVLGSLIACGAFTGSWYLNQDGPHIWRLIVLYGIVGGTGFSCIYVPAVIAVGFYFEKKRALATGIAICGSGIGGFMFPYIIEFLLDLYGWQTTILILGWIALVCGLLGLLYKPLKPKKAARRGSILTAGSPEGTPLLMRIKRARDMIKWDSMNSFNSNHRGSIVDAEDARGRGEKLYHQARKHSTASLKGGGGSHPVSIQGGIQGGGMQKKRMSVPSMLPSTGEPPSFPQAAGVLVNVPNKAVNLKAKSFVGLPDLHEIEEEHGSDEAGSRENSVGPQKTLEKEYSKMKEEQQGETGKLVGNRNPSIISSRIGNSTLTIDEMTNSRIIRVASRVTLNKPLYRDDIFYSGSLLRIPDYANNVMTSMEWTAAVTRPPEPDEDEVALPKDSSCVGSCEPVKKMLDFSLLISPTFIVFCISGMFSMLGMLVPFVYLPNQAQMAVLEDDGAQRPITDFTNLLATIGAANTVGRILSGWIADRPFINVLVLNNFAVTIMGLSTMAVPLLKSYLHYTFYCCIYGISMACFASLRSILVVELLGLAKLTNAFGLLLLFQGIASMVATPLAGTIAERSGSFAMAFYAAGGFLVLSAVMCYPLNKLNHWEKNPSGKLGHD